MNQLVGYDNIIPLVAPADKTSNDTATPYMDLKGVNRAAFLVIFGNIDSGSTDTLTITVEGATDPAGTEAAVAFTYRQSGAVGANTWGAVTAGATTGFTVALTDDNKMYWIEVNPDAMAASDYRYIRLSVDPTVASQMANNLLAVVGLLDTKYKMTTFISATASASS